MNVRAKTLTSLLCSIGALFLVGCVSNADRQRSVEESTSAEWSELASSETCCSDYSEITFAPASYPKHEVAVASGVAREFDLGKSYFTGIQLSGFANSQVLAIKSQLNPVPSARYSNILVPSFLVLDDQLRVIATHENVPLCHVEAWTQDGHGFWGLVNLDTANAWGLVVFAASSARGTHARMHSSATTAGGGVIVESSLTHFFPASPVGRVEIRSLDAELRAWLERKCPALFE
jgi:hypothetical protein